MSFVQEQNKIREDYKAQRTYHHRVTVCGVLCSKQVKAWSVIIIFAITAPVLMYYFIIDRGINPYQDVYTCLVETVHRVPCGVENITSTACENLSCCYDMETKKCYHYLPSKYSYDSTPEGYTAVQKSSPFGTKSIERMKISVNELSKDKVSIILHESKSTLRKYLIDGEKDYTVNLVQEKLMVEIYRADNTSLLLSTTKGPLIASENYWEWTIQLTNHSLFGLNKTLIKYENTSTTVVYKNRKDHYSYPVFWAYNNGLFHGVVIKHEGPLEISVLPGNLIILKSITGRQIELEMSLGPTPKDLHDQLAGEQKIPPDWLLDTYVCRKSNFLELDEVTQNFEIDELAKNYCIDENLLLILQQGNFNNVTGLQEILFKLHEEGKKFILSVQPFIPKDSVLYSTVTDLDILYKYNYTDYNGTYLKQLVVYPDYSHHDIQKYLEALFNFIKSYINITIDGVVLSNNWAENENYNMNGSDFPYFSKYLEEAMSYTIPWNATSLEFTQHIDKHNSYASSQVQCFETYYKSVNQETVIMSASKTFGETYPTIIQNVDASWENFENHINNILFDSIIGNHFVSLPVCGDTSNFNVTIQERLCIRWYIAAATMPLLRVSSTEPWREPSSMVNLYGQQAVRKAIESREKLLSYYYTILSKGEPLLRPMFYDFFENTTTFALTNQYMVGQDILVTHPMTIDRRRLQVYLPSRIGVWFEIWGGFMYNTKKEAWVNVDVRETDFLGFIAQGSIIPLQTGDTIDLIIALNCTESQCQAKGVLLLDDYVDFTADETKITINNIKTSGCKYELGYIKLYHDEKHLIGIPKYIQKNASICTETSTVELFYL